MPSFALNSTSTQLQLNSTPNQLKPDSTEPQVNARFQLDLISTSTLIQPHLNLKLKQPQLQFNSTYTQYGCDIKVTQSCVCYQSLFKLN